MKILRCMYAFAMYCLLVVCLQTSAEGIIAGTLLATPHGLHAIEKLAPGDRVICYDAQGLYQQQSIAHISQHISHNIIQLVVDNQTIYVDGEQRFYLPLDKAWRKVHKLAPGQVVLATLPDVQPDVSGKHYCVIEDVQQLPGLYQVYDLTVPVCHNFCITQLGLLTHNAIVLAPIAATLSVVGAKIMAFFGALSVSAPVTLTSAQATVAAAGTTIGIGASIICDTVKAKRAAERLQQLPSKPVFPAKIQSDINKIVTAQITRATKKEPVPVPQPVTKYVDANQKTHSSILAKNPHNMQVVPRRQQHTPVRKTNKHQHRVGIPRKSCQEHVLMHTAG